MGKRFIRGLWGVVGDERGKLYKRRTKISNDIELIKCSKYQQPFTTFVFGENNYRFLMDNGFDCVLIDKKPIIWDMEKEQFRHKLEVFKRGSEMFDEVVFLDWDTYPIQPFPDDFWDNVARKSNIQATLRTYRRKGAYKRKNHNNKLPCASFVYLKDENTASDIIDVWEKMGRPWSEERAMAFYMDSLMGGDFSMEKYEELFEPDYFYLNECQPFKKYFGENYYKDKPRIFRHLNKNQVNKILKNKLNYEWVMCEG